MSVFDVLMCWGRGGLGKHNSFYRSDRIYVILRLIRPGGQDGWNVQNVTKTPPSVDVRGELAVPTDESWHATHMHPARHA
jgi:hypothetical protein